MNPAPLGPWEIANRVARVLFLLVAIPVAWLSSWLGLLHSVLFLLLMVPRTLLKRGSLRVAEGETVKAGQVLAACGNSGNSSEPHLHIQIQSHASLWDPEIRTFPIHFKGVGYLRRKDTPKFPD